MRARKIVIEIGGVILCLMLSPWILALVLLYFAAMIGAFLWPWILDAERFIRGRLLRDPK